MMNRIHLKEVVAACQIIKSNFRKVLRKWREYKRDLLDMDDMFRLVQDFDKKEGYDQWLLNSVYLEEQE